MCKTRTASCSELLLTFFLGNYSETHEHPPSEEEFKAAQQKILENYCRRKQEKENADDKFVDIEDADDSTDSTSSMLCV